MISNLSKCCYFPLWYLSFIKTCNSFFHFLFIVYGNNNVLYYIIILVFFFFVCYLFSSILHLFLCSLTHSVLSVISHNNDVNQLGRGPFFYFDFSCTPCIMEKIFFSVTAYCNMRIEIQIYIPIVDSCRQTYVNKVTTNRHLLP